MLCYWYSLKSVLYLDNALNHFAVVFYCYINGMYVSQITELYLHILMHLFVCVDKEHWLELN
jgi:hypothetical protein